MIEAIKIKIPLGTGEIELKLDNVCWQCSKSFSPKRETWMLDDNANCGVCHGRQTVLTDAGEAILALVTRYQSQLPTTSVVGLKE